MGAWIEIERMWSFNFLACVAPQVGAWIEINGSGSNNPLDSVAPQVGAWIEINIYPLYPTGIIRSHPKWVRGLKSSVKMLSASCPVVAPQVGAWIEMLCYSVRYSIVKRRTPSGCVD